MQAIDKVRDTSTSHERCSIIEVMGRDAGYLALWCGIANGAEKILLPEEHDYDEAKIIADIKESRKRGKKHYIIINAEGIGDSMNMAKRIEEMGADSICIKDMAGLVKPYAAKKLISALKEELNIPVNLHTHDSTGNGVSTLLMASEAGLDIADCAIGSMSSMTSNPCMNSLVEALKGTERDTGLNPDELTELSQYYARIRPIYKQFESGMDAPNTEIYKYEIPGGQYSNLLAQVKEMGAAEDFEEIKGLYKDANQLLGNIVKVTPSSKVVGDFAIFMFCL